MARKAKPSVTFNSGDRVVYSGDLDGPMIPGEVYTVLTQDTDGTTSVAVTYDVFRDWWVNDEDITRVPDDTLQSDKALVWIKKFLEDHYDAVDETGTCGNLAALLEDAYGLRAAVKSVVTFEPVTSE